jgi:hypothetical protein
MDSITIHELGKARHRELEAEASRYWGEPTTGADKPSLSTKLKLALALSNATLAVLLVAKMLVI